MRETRNWKSALIFSAIFHVIAFAGLSGFVTLGAKEPQEEILEMALIDDLDLYSGMASGLAQETGGSGADDSILPPPPKEQPPAAKPPATYTQPEIKRQKQPSQPKQLTTEPSAEPLAQAETKTSSVEAAAVSGTAKSPGVSGASSGNAAGNSGRTGSGSAVGGGNNSGNGSGSGGGISPPAVLSSVKPPYPPEARKKGIEGVVGLRVLILENGRAGDISVVSSSGDASLDAAALASINSWRFVPAKDIGTGRALARYTRVSVSFELK